MIAASGGRVIVNVNATGSIAIDGEPRPEPGMPHGELVVFDETTGDFIEIAPFEYGGQGISLPQGGFAMASIALVALDHDLDERWRVAQSIVDLARGPDGNIWVGSSPNVFVYDLDNPNAPTYSADSPAAASIVKRLCSAIPSSRCCPVGPFPHLSGEAMEAGEARPEHIERALRALRISGRRLVKISAGWSVMSSVDRRRRARLALDQQDRDADQVQRFVGAGAGQLELVFALVVGRRRADLLAGVIAHHHPWRLDQAGLAHVEAQREVLERLHEAAFSFFFLQPAADRPMAATAMTRNFPSFFMCVSSS